MVLSLPKRLTSKESGVELASESYDLNSCNNALELVMSLTARLQALFLPDVWCSVRPDNILWFSYVSKLIVNFDMRCML